MSSANGRRMILLAFYILSAKTKAKFRRQKLKNISSAKTKAKCRRPKLKKSSGRSEESFHLKKTVNKQICS